MWAIALEATHVVAILWDAPLSERGYILEVNLIKAGVPRVAASAIAKGALITAVDVSLDSSDVSV